jgi:hypothetical protein
MHVLCAKGKVVDTSDKEMCLFVCSTLHLSTSHSKMFKGVQISLKLKLVIYQAHGSLGQQVTRKEKGKKKRKGIKFEEVIR